MVDFIERLRHRTTGSVVAWCIIPFTESILSSNFSEFTLPFETTSNGKDDYRIVATKYNFSLNTYTDQIVCFWNSNKI